jgi:hypothetical protein
MAFQVFPVLAHRDFGLGDVESGRMIDLLPRFPLTDDMLTPTRARIKSKEHMNFSLAIGARRQL